MLTDPQVVWVVRVVMRAAERIDRETQMEGPPSDPDHAAAAGPRSKRSPAPAAAGLEEW